MKKDFKTIYKSLVPEEAPRNPICENPIQALLSGTPARDVAQALRADGWPEGEIAKLFEHLEEVKQSMI